MDRSEVIIVGGGHAGAQAAIALRKNGFSGAIMMIGREAELPYERPPLSKDYHTREKSFDRLLIRPARFWADQNIEMVLGVEVVAVDAHARRLSLSDGTGVSYGVLVWAAGGDARRLTCAGSDLAGVHGIRTRADVDRLVGELDGGARRVVVIGGGYIGLEAAAALTRLPCSVTLLEALPRVLARVAGAALADFFEEQHRRHGVDLRTSARIESILGAQGRATGVRLADGDVVPADLVIVGIGIEPCVGPLLNAGAQGSNGVDVDAFCRTSLPDVYAIGDCAAHANALAQDSENGGMIRLESVQNANDMANTAAKAICGEPEPYQAVPWFWSNQYDLRLQTVGLSAGHDHAVLRGDPGQGSFSVVYLCSGAVIALDCVNRVKDYVQGRQLVEDRAIIAPERLADTAVSLRDMH